MPAAARKTTVKALVPTEPTIEQADPFAPEVLPPDPTETTPIVDLTDEERALLAAFRAQDVAELNALTASIASDGDISAILPPASKDNICPAHFPVGWPEGQAAVSCQHGDDHRVYYVSGNPPAAQKTTGMRGVVEAFDPAAWPDEV